MSHKIITCAGFGDTGSSAATNFFEEFSNVLSVGSAGFECTFLHEADGIIDLYKSLMEGNRLKTDLAIKRFMKLVYNLNFCNPLGPSYKDFFNGHFLDYTREYLQDLGVIKWDGNWHRIDELNSCDFNERVVKSNLFTKKLKKYEYKLYEPNSWRPSYSHNSEMYYCGLEKEKIVSITKKYLTKLLDECDKDNKYEYLLFDQLVPANCNEDYTQFFDDISVIVVDRDPRDLYFANKVFLNDCFIPSCNIETFIPWYSNTRKFLSLADNVLRINFEDFIYNYDKTSKKLIEFTGINEDERINKGKFLIPEKSEKNTRLWCKYQVADKSIYQDIEKIEDALKKYCFKYNPEQLHLENKIKQDYCVEEVNNYINKKRFSSNSLILKSALFNTKLFSSKRNVFYIVFFVLDYSMQFAKSIMRFLKYKVMAHNRFSYFY